MFEWFHCSGQKLPLEVPIGGQEFDPTASGRKLVLKSNCRYMRDLRQRLLENAAAREQREKRLNRFLMEQLKTHEAQEVNVKFLLQGTMSKCFHTILPLSLHLHSPGSVVNISYDGHWWGNVKQPAYVLIYNI